MTLDRKRRTNLTGRIKTLYEQGDFYEARILTFKPDRKPLEVRLNRYIKRVCDIVISLFVIVFILSWLLPILALFIKLTSNGPVFFIQERTGRQHRIFTCIKLRTMMVNNDAHATQTTLNDPRITLAGKFLRKFSLDELPQFLNVLKGDMSVIGPRPHMLKHTLEYSQIIENFHLRQQIRPGITGLSQVEGYRGEIKDDYMLRSRVRLDLLYIRKWNMLLDLMIIVKTAKLVILGDKNAY
jgi:putative colanic acid biosynthesis UDP-glucose lipid carrier transferase